MGILKDLFDIGNGIRSGIGDVPSLVKDVLELDMHGVATDGRKVIGDAKDVVSGLAGLGIDIVPTPLKYLGELGKLADSPIIAAAQLVIESEKKLTGSGSLEEGSEYWESAIYLQKALETLLGAELEDDDKTWDGAAAKAYNTVTVAHRTHVSAVSAADREIGRVLKTEADQVRQTRDVLDSTSQALSDYGLATRALLLIPGVNIAKLIAADTAAATAALGTTSTQMGIMLSNSLQNAADIRRVSADYEKAKSDTSGNAGGCGPFVDPERDQNENLPSSLQPGAPYTPRKQPPIYGPPATPLPVESEAPPIYDLPADLPLPHITPPSRPPGGLPK
ncbi:EspA/EspE family type VII secretion system effector [Mycolicibacterium brisbanense]